MTYSAVPRTAILALGVLALAAGGCITGSGECECPGENVARVSLPAAESNPIIVVTANSHCSAQVDPIDTTRIIVSDDFSGTCQVRAQLMNGAIYTFDVDFESIDLGGCCGRELEPKNQPVPELSDGGIDAGG